MGNLCESPYRNLLFGLLTKSLVRNRKTLQEAGIMKRILYIAGFFILGCSQVFAQKYFEGTKNLGYTGRKSARNVANLSTLCGISLERDQHAG